MRTSWMAVVLAIAVSGCGQSGTDKDASSTYDTALSTCGTDDQAHSDALHHLVELAHAHPKDAAVTDAFTKAWQYEAQHGC